MGITETVDQIMARERANPSGPFQPPFRAVREFEGPEREGLPQNPASPLSPTWPLGAPALLGGFDTRTPQAIGVSFLAVSSGESGFIPPDSMGDVGPTQIVACENGRIKVFDKSGVLGGLNTTTDNFFLSVRSGSGTSDPRVRYDRLTGRWFILMINVSSPNIIMLAVSNGPTITSQTSFTFYGFQQDLVGQVPNADTGLLADYPSLGVDASGVYTAADMFSNPTPFHGTSLWVIRKSSVLSGGPIVVTAFRQVGGASAGIFAPRGVNNDDPASTDGWYIGNDSGSFGVLDMIRIANPGGSPTIAAQYSLTVPATTGPLPVLCLGSVQPLDSINDRLFSAHIHLNRLTGERTLWTAHHFQMDNTGVANDTTGPDGSRWYEIGNLVGTPGLVQAGSLFDPMTPNGTRNFWFPSVMMSGQGHMALGCSVAGATEMAGIATAGRYYDDPLGSTRAPTTAVASSTTYNVVSVPPGEFQRWGDYSNTSVDPSDDMTLWTFQEYCNAMDSWGVRVLQLVAPPPASPDRACPACVPSGQTITVAVHGDTSDHSGFFDPEAGYPQHISASVSGSDITVQSVAWDSPEYVHLTLDIAPGAALGGRTITIINPDGQSRTSASDILNVTATVTCTADVNCDTFVTGDDFDIYTYEFFIGDPAADINCDGFVTGDDFDIFSAAFEAGC